MVGCSNTHNWKFPDKLRRNQATGGHENYLFSGRQTKTLHLNIMESVTYITDHGTELLQKCYINFTSTSSFI